jgi:hypothetical protein
LNETFYLPTSSREDEQLDSIREAAGFKKSLRD